MELGEAVSEGLIHHVRPDDVHESFRAEFTTLSPNCRKIISTELLEDIIAIYDANNITALKLFDYFDGEGMLTQEGYEKLIELQPDVALPNDTLEKLSEEIRAMQSAHYGETAGHPYHNIDHDDNVTINAICELLNLMEIIEIPDSETQCVVIDALAHDLGHAGRTLRQFDPKTGERIKDEVSNEARAVQLLDPILKKYGYSIRQRLASQGRIMSTTFFDFDKANMLRDDEKCTPHTRLERLLAIADLAAGALMQDEDEFLERTKEVLFAEKPMKVWPKDMRDWLKKMHGFFRFFVSSRMLDGQNNVLPEAEAIWGEVFERRRAMFDVLSDENERVREISAQVFGEFLEAARKKFQPYFDELNEV